MNVTVLGAGAWGTALATVLQGNGHAVTLWGHDPEHLETLARTRRNERCLPGIDLPANLVTCPAIDAAIERAEMIVLAVPSKAFRSVARTLAGERRLLVSVTKGIEHATGLTMSGVLADCAPNAPVAVLSGPSLALEVARGIPTAIVAASVQTEASRLVQQTFHRPAFRVYTSADVLGVEFGGALKNVIAVAAGVCDGLGFGDNAKAALITRGIVEMRRLGVACGARAETFGGLSGIGDLTVTCFSKLSRNRAFGESIGRGGAPAELVAASVAVAEGYPTARAAHGLAQVKGVVTPIIDEVFAMLYAGKDARQAVRDLTARDSKAEEG